MGFNKKILALALGSMVGVLSTQTSASIACKNFFYKGHTPLVVNKKLSKDTMDICYAGFAVKYSGVSKTALWSAEFITPEHLKKGKGVKREDNFYEDPKIPSSKRALLSDYRGSGYDRGHLAPSGNRADRVDQNQSFSLANIVPQAPKANQENWRMVEESVRTMVTKNQEPVYIITGPLFLSPKLTKLGSGVLVPSHTYKVVFFPYRKAMSAYVTVNDNIGQTDVVSVGQLQKESGLIFFPTLQGHAVLSERYQLPLNANSAYKTKELQLIGGQSQIFSVMPDPNAVPVIAKKSVRKQAETEIVSQIGKKLSKIEIESLKRELEGISNVFGSGK